MSIRKKIFRSFGFIVVSLAVFYIVILLLFRPSHDREWQLGHEALPQIVYSTESSQISIANYRNFAWTEVNAADIQYETRSFDLDQMSGVDVIISHFDDFEGLAHIFLSFGFTDGNQVVVSLETRRESDESFSPLLGILRQYEMIYVVGSEKDVVGVRTGHRDERVYLYPTKATPEQARRLFDLLAVKINDVYNAPTMYNTLTNNCTNELTRSVEEMSDIDFPLTWKTILPGYFDEVLYDLELIDGEGTFSAVKDRHLIDNTQVDVTSETYRADLRRSLSASMD
ncbi:MAG: DUF4105 domain-containing protein [Bacteroidetes Order II. Incertae sedis bacterium]|jgi:hypothetical protein|nr:DUF4105 domain-containing protein [Bacteroidetes Order II. bacterium]MBT4601852.1 DUF4105 domain-containing protein [Bacteroidetes Order II. bacterium]MBT6424003.1 DUF4105 domain-containing protein [Bacteroidetes Order II. bacterium]MBT6580410.1 DUF4105 domain-containing protein [Bacteroidetes Order II. bacterium]MBT6597760.1 DUF4105 domain-containing protein [Bacteroidetes Order II. bacterium]